MDEQPPNQRRFRKKTILTIVGIVLFASLVGTGVVLWLAGSSEPPAELTQAFDEAGTQQSVGDYQGVINTLTQSEDKAQTTEEKLRLYSEVAAAASSAGDLDKALDYYAKKHQLDPSTESADGYIVGLIYERKDDSQKALEQYKLYVAYLQGLPQDDIVTAKVEGVQEIIQQLEEAQQ